MASGNRSTPGGDPEQGDVHQNASALALPANASHTKSLHNGVSTAGSDCQVQESGEDPEAGRFGEIARAAMDAALAADLASRNARVAADKLR